MKNNPKIVKCRNSLWPSVGVKPDTWKSWGFGVLRDFRLFRARQQCRKHLALGCSWCHQKGRYRKWPHIGNSDICSPSYGQKKGRESNWQFDSRPLKVWNRSLCDIRFESATWRWKDLNEGYNFGLNLVAIGLCSRELWPFKVSRVSPRQFRDSILGVPGICAISMQSPLRAAENTIGSKVVAYSRIRVVMNLVCPSARGLSQHPRVSRMLN